MTNIEVGSIVKVNDPGLAQLRAIMGPSAKPNHIGKVMEIWDDTSPVQILIAFPIGDDPIDEHSQASPYPLPMVKPASPEDVISAGLGEDEQD